jgi:cyclin H
MKPDVSEHLAKAAHAVCDAILLTDAPLIHPPGKLALAALRSAAANTADEPAVEELVERLGSGDASLLGDVNADVNVAVMDAAADLATDLDAVDALVEAQGSEPDEETARAVDKKLRAWHRGGRSGAGDGGEGEGDGGGAREGKRRKSAADERKRKEAAEDAALDGP